MNSAMRPSRRVRTAGCARSIGHERQDTEHRSPEDRTMPRYGESAQKSVERAMHKKKHGTLKSGRSGATVKSRKQAIAIGLSEARKKGAKVPNASKRK
jgi:uncharacterized protein DUF6496